MSLDVSSMLNQYTDYAAQMASNAQTTSKIDTTKDYGKASDEELMDACKKFEAYFLEQCFKEMMKTVNSDDDNSGFLGSSNALMDYYKDNMISELATQSTETNSLGLAQMLYEQMKRNYDL